MMTKKLINEGRIIDWVIIYIMAKKFISPFRKWEAYRLGIIDEKGKRTKKKIETSEEKNAYTPLDRMIRKIRVFVGDRWFLKLTLAFLLFKEEIDYPVMNNLLLEEEDYNIKSVSIGPLEKVYLHYSDLNSNIDFTISSTLKNPETEEEIITSKYGMLVTKSNEENEKYLGFLNSIFGNLLTGGYKEYIINNNKV